MNVKIKSTGVVCLVTDDYDWIYSNLHKQFGDGSAQIFTERTPGSDYLQWELPGDGWLQLSQAEPLTAAQVRHAWIERQRAVEQRFANKDKARRLLSVPDESYVYYKFLSSGELLVRQVAWGYRYPQRAGASALSGVYREKESLQDVVLTLLAAGRPIDSKKFKLNGMGRVTDSDGQFRMGELPVGCEFDVDVDGNTHHIVIEAGKGEIIIDATRPATIVARIRFCNSPYAGAGVLIECGGHKQVSTVGVNGEASVQVPYEEGLQATATVEGHSVSMPLTETTIIELNINAPMVDPPAPPEALQPPVAPPQGSPVVKDPVPPVTEPPVKPDDDCGAVAGGDDVVVAGPAGGSRLLAFLFGLCLALLTLATFWICGGVLFG